MSIKVNIGVVGSGEKYSLTALKTLENVSKDSLPEITEIKDDLNRLPHLTSFQDTSSKIFSSEDGKVLLKSKNKVIIKDNENL